MRWKWILGLIGWSIGLLIVIIYIILVSYDFNRLKPRISQAIREATGRELTLGGDVKIGIGLSPSLKVEKVSFQNAPWGSRPEMAKVKRFEIQVALLPLIRGEFDLKRLILIEPDILLETGPEGKWNFDIRTSVKSKAQEKKAEGQKSLPFLIFDEVRIEKGILTYKGSQWGKTYTLKLESLNASLLGGERPTGVSLKGFFDGRPFEIRGTIGPLADLRAPEKAWPMKLTAKVAGATITADGSIREVRKGKGLDLTINANGPSLGRVAEFGGVPNIPDLGPFKLFAKFTDQDEKFTITHLNALLGDSDIVGSVVFNLSGKQLLVGAELSSQKLDLRPFFLKTDKKTPETHPSGKHTPKREKVFPSEPLSLDRLRAIDGHITMKAKYLQIPSLSLTNFNTDLLLANGNLSAKELKFFISGGMINGQFNLRTQGKIADFKLNLMVDQLDVGSLIKALGAKQMLEGKLDAEIELNGRGRSVAEWMAGLNGRTFVVLGQGRLHNRYLPILGSDLAESLLWLINPFKKEEDYTVLNCFVNGFEIKNGLAVCSALVLDTNDTSIVGGGQINLKEEKLNLSFQPSPKKGVGVSGLGKLSLSLGELAKPFKLGGTLAHPSLTIDLKKTLITVGTAVGGMALWGPAGLLAALASANSGDKNPCLTAIEKAKKGRKVAGGNKTDRKTQKSQ